MFVALGLYGTVLYFLNSKNSNFIIQISISIITITLSIMGISIFMVEHSISIVEILIFMCFAAIPLTTSAFSAFKMFSVFARNFLHTLCIYVLLFLVSSSFVAFKFLFMWYMTTENTSIAPLESLCLAKINSEMLRIVSIKSYLKI